MQGGPGGGHGSFAQREGAAGAWQFSSAVQSAPVGTVTGWPMPVSGNVRTIVLPAVPTGSEQS
jgi:hypothetical protein